MKFTCEKAILQEAIATTAWAVSSKSAIPTLEGLLIEAGSTVKITGYNLETGISTCIPSDVITPGKVVINAKILSDIIRYFPDDVVTISVSETLTVLIMCGNAKYEIMGLPADEFPNLPEIEDDHNLVLSQSTLKSMISQTIFAISTNDNKPVHTGSLFEIENGTLNVVSVDGFRLAIRTEKLEAAQSTDNFSFIVPGHTLKEIEKIMDDVDEEIKIMLGKKHITFTVGETTLISRIMEGEFLNYKNAIPKACSFTTCVSVRDLISSLERVSIIINERIKNPIRCNFTENSMKLSCTTPLGKSQDECVLKSQAQPLEIGFNNRYFLDALKACPDSEVLMELNTHLSPIVLKPIEGDSYLYLILPVRLKSDIE